MRKGWYEKIPVILRWAVTFFIVSIGWITFNVTKFDEFTEFLGYLFGRGGADFLYLAFLSYTETGGAVGSGDLWKSAAWQKEGSGPAGKMECRVTGI